MLYPCRSVYNFGCFSGEEFAGIQDYQDKTHTSEL